MIVVPVLATRPPGRSDRGLLTVEVEVPLFVWVHLLTHKRLARNASSARAQSPARRLLKGFYTPKAWKSKGFHMTPGDELPAGLQAELTMRWERLHDHVAEEVHKMTLLARAAGYTGIANEQINRVFGTSQYMRGILTATEDAWAQIIALRDHAAADEATRDLAGMLRMALNGAEWVNAEAHVPYGADVEPGTPDQVWNRAAARIARVSNGAPGAGRRSDDELAADLLTEQHMSPFEHIARWQPSPLPSALCSKPEDVMFVDDNDHEFGHYGWENVRAVLEHTAAIKQQREAPHDQN